MCENAARGGGSRPLHLRPVDTICFKLNKIGLQNDGDRHNTLPLLTMKARGEVKPITARSGSPQIMPCMSLVN